MPDFLARHSSKSHSSFAYKTSFSGRTHLMTKLKASMHSRLSNFDVKFSLKLEKNHSSSDILLLHSLFSLLNVPMKFIKTAPSFKLKICENICYGIFYIMNFNSINILCHFYPSIFCKPAIFYIVHNNRQYFSCFWICFYLFHGKLFCEASCNRSSRRFCKCFPSILHGLKPQVNGDLLMISRIQNEAGVKRKFATRKQLLFVEDRESAENCPSSRYSF